jgi:hypothetical protein
MMISYQTSNNRQTVEFGHSSLAQKPNGSGVQLINSSFSKGDMATWQIKRKSEWGTLGHQLVA